MSALRFLASWALLLAALPSLAQALPPEVDAALARARLPREAVSLLVVDADGKSAPRLSHRAGVPVNPASVAKLATTFAALELLGPAFTWTTPVYVEGSVRDGTLHGNLYIKGQGDPKLVVERLWLLMRRIQGLGIRAIDGDIVLDRSAFETIAHNPGAFDGEPLRPYNAAPDALLLNFTAVIMTFTPQGGQAQVHLEPPLAGVQLPAAAPLIAGECGDWRGGLKADFSDPSRIRLGGGYPAACGERSWPVAYADPRSYAPRAVAGLWQQMGGTLTGQVRDGRVPAGLVPAFEAQSPPLAEIVRDINKYSNNVMAQQLFLTLSLQQQGGGTLEGSREVMRQWWRERIGARRRSGVRQRLGPVARGADHRAATGAAAAGRLGLALDAGTGVLPSGHRHRWNAEAIARQGRGPRPPENRQPARCVRASPATCMRPVASATCW